MILSRDEMKIKTKKNEKAISVFFFFLFFFFFKQNTANGSRMLKAFPPYRFIFKK